MIWEKKLQKAAFALPIAWEPNHDLSVLNAHRNINDCMQNSRFI